MSFDSMNMDAPHTLRELGQCAENAQCSDDMGKPISGREMIDLEDAVTAIEALNHGCNLVRAKASVTARAVAALRALPTAQKAGA